MSVNITYDVKGLKELEAALRDLRSEMKGDEGNIVASSLMSAALPVLRNAQARVPVDTGKLKASIKRSRVRNPRHYSELITVGVPMPRWQRGKHAVLEESKDALYGAFVEFGTHTRYRSGIMRKGTKQPFLRPALESQARAAIERFKDMAGRKIEKAAQRIGRKRGA